VGDKIKYELEKFLYWIKSDPDKKVPKLADVEYPYGIEDYERFWRRGLKTIAKGKVALVLLAGELCDDRVDAWKNQPLSFLDVGLKSRKRLIQILFERVEAVQRLAAQYRPDKAFLKENSSVHIYIMTSPNNEKQTKEMMKDFLHFGLWKKNIHYFNQG
jgi:UDP-N-acetylglucosamine/UDP-N-acetylgalactosamine diphosphorylase